MTPEDLAFDQRHLWHPYTSTLRPLPCAPVVAAEGCELQLADGTRLLDGMSSWWSAIHGYNVPELNAAISGQMAKMSHVMFGGITHPSAVALGRRLVDITAPELEAVFLADSGSVSVEVALKMALQYWQGRGVEGRSRFAAFSFGYHGDTFGAMSVTDPDNGMHSLFKGFLAQNIFLEAPPIDPACMPPVVPAAADTAGATSGEQLLAAKHACCCNGGTGGCPVADPEIIARWRHTLTQHVDELAAVIIEPVVQGAGGMRIYHPCYLRQLRMLCDELDLLLIFDEIAVGFGRTGKMFAYEHAGIIPDIMTVGKALTGGYMTLAATLATADVAATVCRSKAGVFMHGPTFMANPLACSVAEASIALLLDSPWQQRLQDIESHLRSALWPLAELPSVAAVRVLGGIGVVEMTESIDVAEAQALLTSHGVWLRPFGKLLYTMPPYTMSAGQLEQLTSAMKSFCESKV